jgi:ABC-type Fe3+-hydroxamate transport system substrate-binding protein
MTDDSPHVHRYQVQFPVPYVPRRVISLVPSMTESLFDLNLGGRLIAVTEYCTRPPEGVARLPKVGGTKNPDIARIVALRPDLVIMNREENRRADAEALQAAGIPIWATEPRTVREAIDLLWLIMDFFEEATMTHRVRAVEVAYETTRRYMTAELPVRAFVPIWRDPWMTFNRETFIHDMLYTCGAENVFADRERLYPLAADLGEAPPRSPDDPGRSGGDTRYPRVTLDEALAAQPELILLPDEPYLFSAADEAALAHALADTPAVQNGQVYHVDGSLLTWHGTRIAQALNDLPPLVAAARDLRQG